MKSHNGLLGFLKFKSFQFLSFHFRSYLIPKTVKKKEQSRAKQNRTRVRKEREKELHRTLDQLWFMHALSQCFIFYLQ